MTFPPAFSVAVLMRQALVLRLCAARAPLLGDSIALAALLVASGLLAVAVSVGGGAPGMFALILAAATLGLAGAFYSFRFVSDAVPRAVAAFVLACLPIPAIELVPRLPI
ncbi:hypothetical protein [Jannaschia seohaensis]|uniref:Uncharacterized protein n=1 Tax=Jannaschia seohaensis TaxID=475081 RepID=A0A2Y9ATH0_9RHOB|nr:hypothetical protein [Jannaschia seohaensis]PWJ18113.1 hypothetical protein BCF38_105100 [Jannaschia seohaensis]SSA46638.1 hypothetical protein SAMN05421539_105100 [Jannaschia seohaensis]